MKYQKSRLLLFIMLFVIFTTSCGEQTKEEPKKTNEIGEIKEEEQQVESTDSELEGLPTYNFETLVDDSDKIDITTIKTSYYKEQLDNRLIVKYDELYYAISNFQTEVVLSQGFITPAELQKIMNILYLDTPELYQMASSYSYSLQDEAYVYKVYPVYEYTKEKYENNADNIADYKSNTIFSSPNQTVYQFELETIERLSEVNFTLNKSKTTQTESVLEEVIAQESTTDTSSMYAALFNRRADSIGIAKAFMYCLRLCGIESTLILGENISDELKDNYNIEVTRSVENPITTTSTEDGLFHVKMDFSGYYAWNLVKIKDNWYNVDVTNKNIIDANDKILSTGSGFFGLINTTDETISQTRIFYMNEDYLGISPSCNQNFYQYYYRKGNYILSHTETQMQEQIENILIQLDNENKSKYFVQFEDEKTYNYFIKYIDSGISAYNEEYGNPIELYNYKTFPDSLYIIFPSISYNF